MTAIRSSVIAGALAATLGCAGCSSVHSLTVPTPPASVAGSTTTTVPVVGPGGATLAGTILGPGGPVAGATVQAQRIVGRAAATTEATTAADGSWSIPNVLGGVWRVRAWQAPTLDLLTPQIIYLPGTGTQQMTLDLSQFSGEQLAASTAPSLVTVGGVVDLLASLTQQGVGTDGVVRAEPVVGASIGLSAGAGWAAGGPGVTGSDGTVNFLLTCVAPGSSPITVTATGAADAIAPATTCQEPTPTTSTTTVLPGVTTTVPVTSVPGPP